MAYLLLLDQPELLNVELLLCKTNTPKGQQTAVKVLEEAAPEVHELPAQHAGRNFHSDQVEPSTPAASRGLSNTPAMCDLKAAKRKLELKH